VDAFWVGRLGSAPLAAVMTSLFSLWMLYSFADLVAVGATALVARHVGAGDLGRAGKVATDAVALGLIVSAPFVIAGGFGARAIFRFVGGASEVQELGSAYLSICAAASPVIFSALILEAIARAVGDTRRPMHVLSATLLVNAALDPFLILGWGPFPRLGVQGAAAATVAAQIVGLLLFIRLFKRRDAPLRLAPFRTREMSVASFGRILLIGLPTTLNGILFSFVYLWFGSIAARFGTGSLAAIGLGNRVESLAYLTAYGFSVATAAMVGQNLGAGRPERAERTAWTAVGIIFAFVTAYAVALVLFRRPIVSLFTRDPSVIASGAGFLRVLALCIPFVGPEVVISGAFGGAGNTVPPTVISLPLSLARIPLAWLLAVALGWGPSGIWWTITVTCAVRSLLLVGWFRTNRWKTAGLAAAVGKESVA
jgi:putative MATE family efflux protein